MMKTSLEDNITFIHTFLIDDNKDVLMINESEKLNNMKLNKDYKFYEKVNYLKILINKKYDLSS